MAASSVTNIDGSNFQTQPIARLSASALRQGRILLGLSQGDLARLVRLSSTAISLFELGKTRVLRPRHEKALIEVFAERGIDLDGSAIRLRARRLLAAE
jgi:transcriptional regulator with XRE-family HTH domain